MLERFRELTNIIIELDNTIGFKKVIKYVILILLIIGLFNFKTITKSCIEFVGEMNEEIHNEKMIKRDRLLSELMPILIEFRTKCNADRILYFEYHNSKENLVGIPFKYVDLILQSSSYGISGVKDSEFKDINVGSITTLYEEIKSGNNNLYYHGISDSIFSEIHKGAYEIFCTNSKYNEFVFISIPGSIQPIGLIVMEKIHTEKSTIDNFDVETIINEKNNYIPRITGAIEKNK